MRGGITRAAITDQPGGDRRIGIDREQIGAHLVVQVAGELAALFFLQGQKLFIETAVLGGACRQARRHSIETVAQPRQLRRQPAVNPGAVTAVADLLQRDSQPVERSQGPTYKDIDQANREAAEHAERREALSELVPHFEDLVVRIGLDHDRTVVSISEGYRDSLGLGRNSDEAHKPGGHSAEFRFLDCRCGEGQRISGVPHPQVTVAVEGRHQIVDSAR
jgi:hypothetical protein